MRRDIMPKKNEKKKKIETLEDKMKYEIAQELGLIDKINEHGYNFVEQKEI